MNLEELRKEMTMQIRNLAGSVQDKHESIKKIEEMLEQNEFSFSFINMIEEKIRNDFSLDQLDNFDLVERRVIDWIGEAISIAKDRPDGSQTGTKDAAGGARKVQKAWLRD